jgi:adenine-specific DNA-methyltransferase
LADAQALRKARGAFFTPAPIARYIAAWAVCESTARVLEPSCGEAVFLLAAQERLADRDRWQAALPRTGMPELELPAATFPAATFPAAALPAVELPAVELHGVELHEPSAASARTALSAAAGPGRTVVTTADLFALEPTGDYDAVIGNPPFVRYQDFTGPARSLSRSAARRAGVELTGLASSWAAFTIQAALFLRTGGRLGLVLPAELLSVNYAAQVRQFLLSRFAHVQIVLFQERVFPAALEDVVLLLAKGFGQGPSADLTIRHARNVDDLTVNDDGDVRSWRPARPDQRWTPALLHGGPLAAYASALAGSDFTHLRAWGQTKLGTVTGNNAFFALSAGQVRTLGLEPSDLLPLSPPGSRHLRGLAYGAAEHDRLTSDGSRVWLLRPEAEPSPAASAYIAAGEAAGVDGAYKCRVRTPWWRVPPSAQADLMLTYMNADTPRLSTNHARVHHLNSVHGVYLDADLRALGRELLPLGSLNSLTLLGAETVGRAYGGGLLKLEPREADGLPMPGPPLLAKAAQRLERIRPDVVRALSAGNLRQATRWVDDVLLIGELGLPAGDVQALRTGYDELSGRRANRARRPS